VNQPSAHHRRRGAIAVVLRQGQLLVIRRAAGVEAPGTYCFPGGAIEPGESPRQAVCRELQEELGVEGQAERPLWQSVTPWNVELSWWLTRVEPGCRLVPNPAEVAEVLWLTPGCVRRLPALLESNRQFLDAWQAGAFRLGHGPPDWQQGAGAGD